MRTRLRWTRRDSTLIVVVAAFSLASVTWIRVLRCFAPRFSVLVVAQGNSPNGQGRLTGNDLGQPYGTDPWGLPWRRKLTQTSNVTTFVYFYSCGPNEIDEGGDGDDIELPWTYRSDAHGAEARRWARWIAPAAHAVFCLWLWTWIPWRSPPRRWRTEALLVAVAALPPTLLGIRVLAHLGGAVTHVLPMLQSDAMVSGGTVALGVLVAASGLRMWARPLRVGEAERPLVSR